MKNRVKQISAVVMSMVMMVTGMPVNAWADNLPPEEENEIACEHNYEDTERIEPSCTEAGKIISVCSLCGDTLEEEIPAIDHSFEENENGIFVCSVCGTEKSSEVPVGPIDDDLDASNTVSGNNITPQPIIEETPEDGGLVFSSAEKMTISFYTIEGELITEALVDYGEPIPFPDVTEYLPYEEAEYLWYDEEFSEVFDGAEIAESDATYILFYEVASTQNVEDCEEHVFEYEQLPVQNSIHTHKRTCTVCGFEEVENCRNANIENIWSDSSHKWVLKMTCYCGSERYRDNDEECHTFTIKDGDSHYFSCQKDEWNTIWYGGLGTGLPHIMRNGHCVICENVKEDKDFFEVPYLENYNKKAELGENYNQYLSYGEHVYHMENTGIYYHFGSLVEDANGEKTYYSALNLSITAYDSEGTYRPNLKFSEAYDADGRKLINSAVLYNENTNTTYDVYNLEDTYLRFLNPNALVLDDGTNYYNFDIFQNTVWVKINDIHDYMDYTLTLEVNGGIRSYSIDDYFYQDYTYKKDFWQKAAAYEYPKYVVKYEDIVHEFKSINNTYDGMRKTLTPFPTSASNYDIYRYSSYAWIDSLEHYEEAVEAIENGTFNEENYYFDYNPLRRMIGTYYHIMKLTLNDGHDVFYVPFTSVIGDPGTCSHQYEWVYVPSGTTKEYFDYIKGQNFISDSTITKHYTCQKCGNISDTYLGYNLSFTGFTNGKGNEGALEYEYKRQQFGTPGYSSMKVNGREIMGTDEFRYITVENPDGTKVTLSNVVWVRENDKVAISLTPVGNTINTFKPSQFSPADFYTTKARWYTYDNYVVKNRVTWFNGTQLSKIYSENPQNTYVQNLPVYPTVFIRLPLNSRIVPDGEEHSILKTPEMYSLSYTGEGYVLSYAPITKEQYEDALDDDITFDTSALSFSEEVPTVKDVGEYYFLVKSQKEDDQFFMPIQISVVGTDAWLLDYTFYLGQYDNTYNRWRFRFYSPNSEGVHTPASYETQLPVGANTALDTDKKYVVLYSYIGENPNVNIYRTAIYQGNEYNTVLGCIGPTITEQTYGFNTSYSISTYTNLYCDNRPNAKCLVESITIEDGVYAGDAQEYTFYNISKLKELDVSMMDFSDVVAYKNFIYKNPSLEKVKLDGENRSNVIIADSMIANNDNLAVIENLPSFTGVKSMQATFVGNFSLKELDLSNWSYVSDKSIASIIHETGIQKFKMPQFTDENIYVDYASTGFVCINDYGKHLSLVTELLTSNPNEWLPYYYSSKDCKIKKGYNSWLYYPNEVVVREYGSNRVLARKFVYGDMESDWYLSNLGEGEDFNNPSMRKCSKEEANAFFNSDQGYVLFNLDFTPYDDNAAYSIKSMIAPSNSSYAYVSMEITVYGVKKVLPIYIDNYILDFSMVKDIMPYDKVLDFFEHNTSYDDCYIGLYDDDMYGYLTLRYDAENSHLYFYIQNLNNSTRIDVENEEEFNEVAKEIDEIYYICFESGDILLGVFLRNLDLTSLDDEIDFPSSVPIIRYDLDKNTDDIIGGTTYSSWEELDADFYIPHEMLTEDVWFGHENFVYSLDDNYPEELKKEYYYSKLLNYTLTPGKGVELQYEPITLPEGARVVDENGDELPRIFYPQGYDPDKRYNYKEYSIRPYTHSEHEEADCENGEYDFYETNSVDFTAMETDDKIYASIGRVFYDFKDSKLIKKLQIPYFSDVIGNKITIFGQWGNSGKFTVTKNSSGFFVQYANSSDTYFFYDDEVLNGNAYVPVAFTSGGSVILEYSRTLEKEFAPFLVNMKQITFKDANDNVMEYEVREGCNISSFNISAVSFPDDAETRAVLHEVVKHSAYIGPGIHIERGYGFANDMIVLASKNAIISFPDEDSLVDFLVSHIVWNDYSTPSEYSYSATALNYAKCYISDWNYCYEEFEGEALGHDYDADNVTIVRNPSIFQTGIKEFYCTRCNATIQEEFEDTTGTTWQYDYDHVLVKYEESLGKYIGYQWNGNQYSTIGDDMQSEYNGHTDLFTRIGDTSKNFILLQNYYGEETENLFIPAKAVSYGDTYITLLGDYQYVPYGEASPWNTHKSNYGGYNYGLTQYTVTDNIKKITLDEGVLMGLSLYDLFYRCEAEEYDLSKADFSYVEYVGYMFENSKLKKVDFGGQNTPNLRFLNDWFYMCDDLEEINNMLTIPNAYSIPQGMFSVNDHMKTLDLSNITITGYALTDLGVFYKLTHFVTPNYHTATQNRVINWIAGSYIFEVENGTTNLVSPSSVDKIYRTSTIIINTSYNSKDYFFPVIQVIKDYVTKKDIAYVAGDGEYKSKWYLNNSYFGNTSTSGFTAYSEDEAIALIESKYHVFDKNFDACNLYANIPDIPRVRTSYAITEYDLYAIPKEIMIKPFFAELPEMVKWNNTFTYDELYTILSNPAMKEDYDITLQCIGTNNGTWEIQYSPIFDCLIVKNRDFLITDSNVWQKQVLPMLKEIVGFIWEPYSSDNPMYIVANWYYDLVNMDMNTHLENIYMKIETDQDYNLSGETYPYNEEYRYSQLLLPEHWYTRSGHHKGTITYASIDENFHLDMLDPQALALETFSLESGVGVTFSYEKANLDSNFTWVDLYADNVNSNTTFIQDTYVSPVLHTQRFVSSCTEGGQNVFSSGHFDSGNPATYKKFYQFINTQEAKEAFADDFSGRSFYLNNIRIEYIESPTYLGPATYVMTIKDFNTRNGEEYSIPFSMDEFDEFYEWLCTLKFNYYTLSESNYYEVHNDAYFEKCKDINKDANTNYYYEEEIAPTEHDYIGKITLPATLMFQGEITYYCKKCGHSYIDYYDSGEYVDYTIRIPALCDVEYKEFHDENGHLEGKGYNTHITNTIQVKGNLPEYTGITVYYYGDGSFYEEEDEHEENAIYTISFTDANGDTYDAIVVFEGNLVDSEFYNYSTDTFVFVNSEEEDFEPVWEDGSVYPVVIGNEEYSEPIPFIDCYIKDAEVGMYTGNVTIYYSLNADARYFLSRGLTNF